MDPILDIVDPSIYEYGLYSEESMQEVCKMLRYCMKKHKTLSKYVNSIVFRSSDHPTRYARSTTRTTPGIASTTEIVHDFLRGNKADLAIVNEYAKIQFDNFNLKNLVDKFSNRSYRNDDKSLSRTIYNLDKDSQYTATTLNENIDPDFKRLPGHFLNASTCHMLLNNANNGHSKRNRVDCIAEFILYGDKDTLIAYVTTDSQLVIRWQVIKYLVENCGYYSVRRVIEKIFLRFSEVYDFIMGRNPTHMKKMIAMAAENLWDYENENELLSRVQNHIDHSIYSDQVDITFYQPMLLEVAASARRMVEEAKRDALMAGMALSSKMAMLGWTVSEFGKNINNLVWWEKEVEIVPKILVYNYEQYVIPDDYKNHPYKVTKLYISSAAIMYCEGKHPNVSGGKVCMGDLRTIDFLDADFEEIKEFLDAASKLLDIMNYDSPHESCHRKTFMKVAKKSLIGDKDQEVVARTDIHNDVGVRQITIQAPTPGVSETGEVEEEAIDEGPPESPQEVEEEVPLDQVEAMDNGRVLTTIQRAPYGAHEFNVEFMRMIRDMCRTPDRDLHELAINSYVWLCRNLHNRIVIGQCEDQWGDTAYFIYKDRNYVPFRVLRQNAESLLGFMHDKKIEHEMEVRKPDYYIPGTVKVAIQKLNPHTPLGSVDGTYPSDSDIDELIDELEEDF